MAAYCGELVFLTAIQERTQEPCSLDFNLKYPKEQFKKLGLRCLYLNNSALDAFNTCVIITQLVLQG